MKTIKTKTINIATAWNSLRTLPPRDFQNIEEMEKAVSVIDGLGECIPDFTFLLKDESDRIGALKGTMKDEDYVKLINELTVRITELELKTGKDVIKCDMEDAVFNSFFQLFEKYGKNWFVSVQEFLSFRKEINETNQQPKAVKAKVNAKK